MAEGKVKWFNNDKRYGFIQPDDGTKDVFLHVSALEDAGIPSVNEGQSLRYEVTVHKGRAAATNVKLSA